MWSEVKLILNKISEKLRAIHMTAHPFTWNLSTPGSFWLLLSRPVLSDQKKCGDLSEVGIGLKIFGALSAILQGGGFGWLKTDYKKEY